MNTSCPVLTVAEKHYLQIQEKLEREMMATIYEAIAKASEQASQEMRAVEIDVPAPAREYFVSVAHQKLFLLLCGADTETFEGGDPEIANNIIQNGMNIRDHYWIRRSET